MKKTIIYSILLMSSLQGFKAQGIYNSFGLYYGFPTGKSKAFINKSFGILFGSGYPISSYFGLGANFSAGLMRGDNSSIPMASQRTYMGYNLSMAVAPRINFINSYQTPFLSLDAGYVFNNTFNAISESRSNNYNIYAPNIPGVQPKEDIPTKGFYIEPTIGMRFDYMSVSAGYAMYYNKYSVINLKLCLEYGQNVSTKANEKEMKKKLEELDKQMEQQQESRKLESKSSSI